MITYTHNNDGNVMVFLCGVHVGFIAPVDGGFRYSTKDRRSHGEVLPTVRDVKVSLEGDDAEVAG